MSLPHISLADRPSHRLSALHTKLHRRFRHRTPKCTMVDGALRTASSHVGSFLLRRLYVSRRFQDELARIQTTPRRLNTTWKARHAPGHADPVIDRHSSDLE
jgi:hypothetical protein